MINNKVVCSLIPARGGSKGIPRKNMVEIKDRRTSNKIEISKDDFSGLLDFINGK